MCNSLQININPDQFTVKMAIKQLLTIPMDVINELAEFDNNIYVTIIEALKLNTLGYEHSEVDIGTDILYEHFVSDESDEIDEEDIENEFYIKYDTDLKSNKFLIR